MKAFYKSLSLGFAAAITKYLLWKFELTFWDLGLISISGLVAGVFFILSIMFKSALNDYKTAEKNVCFIRGKICSMNDINMNAALLSKGKYLPQKLGKYLIEMLREIKRYLQGNENFSELQDKMNGLVQESVVLDDILPANKVSRFQQYHDSLRGFVSYLEYAKFLNFPKVGYVFLDFFIFSIFVLQIFSKTNDIMLETVFVFSLFSVLIFFAELIHDIDRPFEKGKTSFAVDLKPLDIGMQTIKKSLEDFNQNPAKF